jgi:diphosphomevalonate decarboxylase
MPTRIHRAHIVRQLLGDRTPRPVKPEGSAFAPSNIALCKYWGKRQEELNLPVTSSLSISLGELGTRTLLRVIGGADQVTLNGQPVPPRHKFARGVTQFLNLFRAPGQFFAVETVNSIPTAAGLASSASGFAALTLAVNDLFDWRLDARTLSILARLGSGSASRSIFRGFVLWHAGAQGDGLDSFAEELPYQWPDLRIGLLTLSEAEKPIGSREAMKRTKRSSLLYQTWPSKVAQDLAAISDAIAAGDFDQLGRTAESNALWPCTPPGWAPGRPYCSGCPRPWPPCTACGPCAPRGCAPTAPWMPAPNVKLIFLAEDEAALTAAFPALKVIAPFAGAKLRNPGNAPP